ncbi:aspartate racemase [Lachnoclostridium sp. An14]|uniref:aspartate/glutamate racemase family protein n=1 Tax=Lachnoclostridium sp. An14 TaxID=1965562 RepID=UPI000B371353|nr:aspartate/glutamate racemase family protein [Lachnoclostridium sp. An14]OUQ17243.1 aspartate racemase [Lachnoclostridium sp. An14]
MKRIGLLGGMSWESTVTYYQMINEAVKRRLGGLHSAELVLYSVDFAEIEKCQAEGDWERSGEILGEAAAALERAGAEMILICTNTMHKVAPQIQANIQVPLVHIAEATADELNRRGIRRAALLGTKYTMTQDFYKAKLVDAGIEVLVPDEADMETVNDVIYQELCLGEIRAESKEKFLAIIRRLESQGAEGVILGCTEIGLLVKQEDVELPVFDTTLIHGEKAVEMALE